jgi:hypothetical protein
MCLRGDKFQIFKLQLMQAKTQTPELSLKDYVITPLSDMTMTSTLKAALATTVAQNFQVLQGF